MIGSEMNTDHRTNFIDTKAKMKSSNYALQIIDSIVDTVINNSHTTIADFILDNIHLNDISKITRRNALELHLLPRSAICLYR